jgi:ubiquinone/menaquinone biosynthesis C-methylase UbiE
MEEFLYQDMYQLEDQHWWHQAKRQLVIEALRKFVKPTAQMKLLDLGCGTGKNLEAFAELIQTQGIDISPAAIKFCRQRGLTKVTQGDIADTKLKKSSIDVVTMLDVLEHVDEQPVLTEVSRILDDEGWLIITVPAFAWLWSTWDEVLHHKRRYTRQTLEDALAQHGFQVVRISYVYSFLVLPVYLVRLIKSKISQDEYESDFKLSSGLINRIGRFICAVERKIIWSLGIPFGTSLIVVARKK